MANDEETPGYKLQRLRGFVDKSLTTTLLLLPNEPRFERLVEQKEAQARLDMDAAEARQYEDDAADELNKRFTAIPKKDDDLKKSSRVNTRFNKFEKDELDYDTQKSKLFDKFITDTGVPDPNKFQVYDWDEPLKLILAGRIGTPDKDVRLRNEELFSILLKKGNFRSFTSASTSGCIAQLDEIISKQPHFAEVVSLVKNEVLLAHARNQFVKIPPILVFGEQGIGKTHFSQSLAAAMSTKIHRHGFDTASTDASLIGSDKHWGNTSYGSIFELVCLGDCANPILLLDEIDKVVVSPMTTRDPLGPLHSLLEPVTSSAIKDLSVDITFDASLVTYIATANNPRRVPQTIRSRFVEFHIQPPDAGQALQVAKAVAISVEAEMMLPDFDPISSRLVAFIAHLSAREQGQALRRAYASAVSAGRTAVTANDLPSEVLYDEPILSKTTKLH